jgi:hypothetical protein
MYDLINRKLPYHVKIPSVTDVSTRNACDQADLQRRTPAVCMALSQQRASLAWMPPARSMPSSVVHPLHDCGPQPGHGQTRPQAQHTLVYIFEPQVNKLMDKYDLSKNRRLEFDEFLETCKGLIGTRKNWRDSLFLKIGVAVAFKALGLPYLAGMLKGAAQQLGITQIQVGGWAVRTHTRVVVSGSHHIADPGGRMGCVGAEAVGGQAQRACLQLPCRRIARAAEPLFFATAQGVPTGAITYMLESASNQLSP